MLLRSVAGLPPLAGLLRLFALPTLLAILVLAAPARALVAPGSAELPDFDVRATTKPEQPEQRAMDRVAGHLPEGFADASPQTGGLAFLGSIARNLTGPSEAPAPQAALDYVRDHREAFGLDAQDVEALQLTDSYESIDGVTHLTWSQVSHGVASYDTYLRANVAKDGSLINLSGAPVGDFAVANATPAIGARDALAIAREDVGGAGDLPGVTDRRGADRTTEFGRTDEAAALTAFTDGDTDRLGWQVDVYSDESVLYQVVVDASNGRVLARHSLTDWAANDATIWRNFPNQTQSPTTVNLGSDPSWIDRSAANGNILLGNNADAYSDINGTNGRQAGEEVARTGSNDWVFDTTFFANAGNCPAFGCTSDTASTLTNNRQDATTDLFYATNLWHDHLLGAPIGFDEASHNFEFVNSSGAPGAGDPVLAEGNDASGINNANFATPPDGASGRMQMYLWNGQPWNPPQDMNGTYSWDVIFHEYTHGLTNRLVGNGGGGLNAVQSGSMGEAWSDWYAMDYLVSQGLQADTAAPGEVFMGEYVTGVPGTFGGAGPSASRIRHQAIDCTVGAPATACATNGGTAGTGGYTYSDLGKVGTANGVHDNGEIWSQTLWDLRTAIGSNNALAVVTGGLRLSPLNPSFLQMRNAILQSARNLGIATGPIWQVFANRGMGYLAVDNGAGSLVAVDDFTAPQPLQHISTAIADPAPLGDGDGYADPGETVRVSETLENTTSGAIGDAAGTMSSADALVGEPSASWPAIPAGAQVQNSTPFTATISEGAACGSSVTLSFNAGASTGGITIPDKTLTLGGPTFADSTDVPKPIPDNNAAGVNSTFTFPGGGTVTDLDVRIGSLTHTWVGDLKITLEHSGTTVVLMNRPGSGGLGASGDNFVNLILDDEATTPIESIPSTNPPGGYTGSYTPDQPLSAFDGQDRSGTWTLNVSDNAGADTGTLQSWGLSSSLDCATSAPALPNATTSAATETTLTGATLNGQLDANGTETSYAFEYGETADYGTRTAQAAGGSAADPVPISTAIEGLGSGTAYHFRSLALRDGVVIARGADQTFATQAPTPAGGGGTGSGGTGGGGTAGAGADTTGPNGSVSGKKSQDIDKLALTVTSDEDATASGQATVKLPAGAKKAVKSKRAKANVAAGGRTKLKFKFAKKSLKLVKKAIAKKGKNPKAKIVVELTDPSGNTTKLKKSVKLKD